MSEIKKPTSDGDKIQFAQSLEVKRRAPRRPIERKVGLLVAGRYMLGKALEIGEGGVLIEAPELLRQGQRVVVTFRIPGVLQGAMLSHVMYTVEPQFNGDQVRYGLQFDKVEFDVKRKLRNFVASGQGGEENHSPRNE